MWRGIFPPLPKEIDLAIMDRFCTYLPGWEMLKNSSEFLTSNYDFITDYLAEAFHYQLKHTNRYEDVSRRIKLGKDVQGRDEKGIKKNGRCVYEDATSAWTQLHLIHNIILILLLLTPTH